ncbi:MAG: hypothetical protein HQ541_04760, partial [Mariniphaga sp.]|nr:hypothetical protein [Mariniphaga sp.]
MLIKFRFIDYSKKIPAIIIISIVFILSTSANLLAQSEVMAWGNIIGIRIDGQLMEFETSLRLVSNDWDSFTATAKERQRPQYDREGNLQTVSTGFGGQGGFRSRTEPHIGFTQIIEDVAKGTVSVNINSTVTIDTIVEGIFFCIDLPTKYYSSAAIQFINGSPSAKSNINIVDINAENNNDPFKITAKGLTIESPQRQLNITFDSKSKVFLRKELGNTQVYVELLGSKLKKGKKVEKNITI